LESIEELYVTLGKLIRLRREAAGLTQEELAHRVGLTRTSITNVESGRQKVQVHTLYAIAQALDIFPEALLPPPPGANLRLLPQDLTWEEREWAERLLAEELR
jgi:transcriptional regulator with XRE-family HTH domain